MDDPKTYGTRVIWRSGWVWVPFRIRRCHPIESWKGQLVEMYAQLLPRYPFISPFLSFSLSAFCSLPLGAGFRDCYATSSLYSLWNHEATLPALTLEPLLGETMRRFSCSSGRERVVFPPSFRSSSGWRCINKSKDDRFLPHFRIYIYFFFNRSLSTTRSMRYSIDRYRKFYRAFETVSSNEFYHHRIERAINFQMFDKQYSVSCN